MNECILGKNYEKSQPRTCVTVAEEQKKEKRKEIREQKEIENIILENVQQTFDFVAYELPEIECSPREQSGLLWRRFLLSHVRSWCVLSEADDDLILLALDDLIKKGKLKIFDIQLTKEMNHNDCGFSCELGRAKRTLGNIDVELNVERLYSKKPLGKRERDEHTILNVKETVADIRQKRDEYFKKQFGWSNEAEIERQLHREDIEDEAEFRSSVIKLVNIISDGEKEKRI